MLEPIAYLKTRTARICKCVDMHRPIPFGVHLFINFLLFADTERIILWYPVELVPIVGSYEAQLRRRRRRRSPKTKHKNYNMSNCVLHKYKQNKEVQKLKQKTTICQIVCCININRTTIQSLHME